MKKISKKSIKPRSGTAAKSAPRRAAPAKASADTAPKATEATTSPDAATAAASTPEMAQVVESLSPVVVGNELRKKELFDLVVERSGKKKKDVKPIVEAMLAVMGDALSEHREMQLPPLGKLKVQRGKEMSDGRALVLKLRQKSASLNAAPADPSATAAE